MEKGAAGKGWPIITGAGESLNDQIIKTITTSLHPPRLLYQVSSHVLQLNN